MARKKYKCSICNGQNVEVKIWVNPNFDKKPNIPNQLEEDADIWCEDCEKHVELNIE